MSNNLKPTKRKAFNFLRSYFDVLNELEKDDDKLNFLLSIINKQFLDEDPKDLNFIVNLCYESQRHAIESSVKGWKRVNKEVPPSNPTTDPTTNPTTNPTTDPKQVEVKEKVKEKEEIYKTFAHLSISVLDFDKLVESGYSKMQVDNVLESIENYANNKKYKSLYLTAKKWLAKEQKQTQVLETILIPNTEW